MSRKTTSLQNVLKALDAAEAEIAAAPAGFARESALRKIAAARTMARHAFAEGE